MTKKKTETMTEGNIVRNQDCYDAIPALSSLADIEVPAQMAIKLRKTIKAIQEHVQVVEDQRQAILKRHADVGEDGQVKTDSEGRAIFENGNQEAFSVEYRELMECEWPEAPTISLEGLGNAKIKTGTLLALDPFVEMDD